MPKHSYYPGHMAKTKAQLKQKLKWADIVYEVADARAPLSSRNEDLAVMLENRPSLLVLNKADLADAAVTKRFVGYFEGRRQPSMALEAHNPRHIARLFEKSQSLLERKFAELKQKGIEKRPIRAIVVGTPNVGKSTLINQLIRRRAVQVADTPNLTRHLQTVRLHDDLELLDTPGLLLPKFDKDEQLYNLGLIGALKDHLVPRDEVVIHGFKVLYEQYREAFVQRYDLKLDTFDSLEIFEQIGRRLGCLDKGGTIDYETVMDKFLRDFRHGRFGGVSLERIGG